MFKNERNFKILLNIFEGYITSTSYLLVQL